MGTMTTWLVTIYCLIAAFFVWKCLNERHMKSALWNFDTFNGVLLGIVWPLAVLMIVVTLAREEDESDRA